MSYMLRKLLSKIGLSSGFLCSIYALPKLGGSWAHYPALELRMWLSCSLFLPC